MENKLGKIENIEIKAFQEDLISWFKREQRDLPWRKDKDPYKVWVSEIMLQQTRVDTVIPYFNRFIDLFPTVEDLAEAEEQTVLKAWEGLGYYSRVRNLQSAVKEVEEKYNGVVPNSPKELSELKGVGPYTTGAILSIAYGIPAPAVDGNVMRVLSRILSISEDIAKLATRKVFESAVRQLISQEEPSSFNQALMELGALICIPVQPACLLCPVREHCQAFHEGIQNKLPIKSKKSTKKNVKLAAMVLENAQGKVIIHKRPDKGLLANLWEFPSVEIHLSHQQVKKNLSDLFGQSFGFNVKPEKVIGQIEHIFSHLVWNIEVYTGKLISGIQESPDIKLVSLDDMNHYPFPVPHQKIWELYCDYKHK